MTLTLDQLTSLVAPYGKPAIIENTVTSFNQYSDNFGINTPLRKAHFLAQLAHESDHFKTTVEYGGPSKRYAPWYGRGLIQTTWKENYVDFYKWCGSQNLSPPDFTGDAVEQVSRFPWAFICAIWYWDSRNLNELADADNVRAITKKINGGYNGLDERIKLLNKAKRIFGEKPNAIDAAPGSIVPRKSYKAIDVQNALVAKGMKIDADGKMGPQTIAAVKMFQKINGLVPDGVMGPKTAQALGI